MSGLKIVWERRILEDVLYSVGHVTALHTYESRVTQQTAPIEVKLDYMLYNLHLRFIFCHRVRQRCIHNVSRCIVKSKVWSEACPSWIIVVASLPNIMPLTQSHFKSTHTIPASTPSRRQRRRP